MMGVWSEVASGRELIVHFRGIPSVRWLTNGGRFHILLRRGVSGRRRQLRSAEACRFFPRNCAWQSPKNTHARLNNFTSREKFSEAVAPSLRRASARVLGVMT